MNVYTHRFSAVCPANAQSISYTFKLTTEWLVKVEEIQKTFPDNLTKFHEELADQLYAKFGGEQVLEAWHHGTHIRTQRP